MPVEIVDEIIDAAEYWPSTTTMMAPPEKHEQRMIRKDRDQVLLKTVPLCFDRKVCFREGIRPDDVCANQTHPTIKQLEQSPDSPRPLPHRSCNRPCRKIVFRLSSHDQGPGRIHKDMYDHSWTWFDAEVIHGAHERKMYVNGEEKELLNDEKGETAIPREPDDPLLLPRANKIQVNGARVSERQDVEIIWHYRDNIPPDSPPAYDIERTTGRGRATLDGRFVREMQVGDSIAVWARARFPGWSNHVYSASVTIFWAV